MKLIKLILFLMCCVLSAGTVFAQKELKSLPDDPLYQAKRRTETAKLNASFDPLERATLHIGSAKKRLAEAQAQGRDVSKALEAVERYTKKHAQVLANLLGKVPEEARPAIEHAIEVSQRGRNTALDRLGRIQRGEVPDKRPEWIERPEKPEGLERKDEETRKIGYTAGGIDRQGGFGGHGAGKLGGSPPRGKGR